MEVRLQPIHCNGEISPLAIIKADSLILYAYDYLQSLEIFFNVC